MVAFRAIVELGGKTATGIEIPAGIVEELGAGKRPAIQIAINGYRYRTTIGSMGGRSMVPISAEHRANAGVAAGDEVAVEIALDTEPREVVVPPDLAEALGQDPTVRQIFDSLSYSNQSRHVLAVEGAKTPETRQRRIEKVIATLQDDRA